MARLHVGLAFGIAVFLLLVVAGVTASKQPKTVDVKMANNKISRPIQPTVATKIITVTQVVGYTTKTEDSNSLDKGQTKTVQTGENGSETLTYKLTYTSGKQTSKMLISTDVTTQPVQEIVEEGTYITPVSTPSSATNTPNTSAPSLSCHPVSNEGTCYRAGEYCRESDAGTTGVAGNGESIICEDNDGLRWEPN